MIGDGTCEGLVCDLNADCVTLNNSVGPEKECRCKPGYTGKGLICSGELFVVTGQSAYNALNIVLTKTRLVVKAIYIYIQ